MSEPERPVAAPPNSTIDDLELTPIIDPDGSLRTAPTCEQALGNPQVSASDDAAAVERIVVQAERVLRRGNVKVSHTLMCKALAMDGQSARAMLGLSQVLLARRDAAAAARYCRLASKLPGAPQAEVRTLLGDAVVRLGKSEVARDLWVGGGADPKTHSADIQRYGRETHEDAATALARKDYHQAERLYRRVLTLAPENNMARRKLAVTLEGLRLFSAAQYWIQSSPSARGSESE